MLPNCPITNKPYNCKECEVPNLSGGKCPQMKLDDTIADVLKDIRKYLESKNEPT